MRMTSKPRGSYDPCLFIPLDEYVSDLRNALSDAEWDENDTQAEHLRYRIDRAMQLIEAGDTLLPLF